MKHRSSLSLLSLCAAALGCLLLTGCPPVDKPPPGVQLHTPKARRLKPTKAIAPKKRRVTIKLRQRKPVKFIPTKQPASGKVRRNRQGKVALSKRKLSPANAALARRMKAMGAGRKSSVTPVYFASGLKPNSLAKRLCHAMHTLPAQQKAKCCQTKGLGFVATKECVRNLSIALKIGAISLEEKVANRCIQALKTAYRGCGWVGLWGPTTPKECLSMFVGKLKMNAPCRSSLECKKGLHCYGLGTTRAGRCYPPLPKGSQCGTGVDTLATYTRQDTLKKNHPLCKGYCTLYRCQSFLPKGSKCKADIQCQPGNYCKNKICSPGKYAPPGGVCSGRCAPGYRCVRRKCVRLKEKGELCTSEFECRGGCMPVPGKKIRRCGVRCKSPIFDKR